MRSFIMFYNKNLLKLFFLNIQSEKFNNDFQNFETDGKEQPKEVVSF